MRLVVKESRHTEKWTSDALGAVHEVEIYVQGRLVVTVAETKGRIHITVEED